MSGSYPVLSGLPLEELKEIIAPLPSYRAMQISNWISKGKKSFDRMINLPLSLRAELDKKFLLRPNIKEKRTLKAADGTVKLILKFEDESCIEAVLLNDGNGHYTICLSVQSGCPVGCVFCKTGSLGFRRNLTSDEIVEQFLELKEFTGSNVTKTNIVIMGMGEPLLNLSNLRRAIKVICCKNSFNYSSKRITISTCGIVCGIKDIADNGPTVRLAISLTTADEDLRQKLMPLPNNKRLKDLKNAILYFQNRGGGRITIEAVLLGDINTREKDALSMAKFCNGLNVNINLIPWNPVNGLCFQEKALKRPTIKEINSFSDKLKSHGLKVTCRFRRGLGITGACGQLG